MFRAIKSTPSSSASEDVHFYTSSGGNAGLACATAAKILGRLATVVVPLTTPAHMMDKIRALGAEVVQVGENWAAADRHLRGVTIPGFEREHPASRAVYVPPFDHRDIWDGAETLVGEVEAHISRVVPHGKVDGIVCSVGGGGLMCGIMQGLQKTGRGPSNPGGPGKQRPVTTTKVLAVETRGGDSLNASVRAGELVTLPAITTIATSLGATRVAQEAFEWTRRAGANLISTVVTDQEVVVAMIRFLDDAKMLVESACGATIATVYNGDLRRHFGKGLTDEEWAGKNVVLVVCGGSNINLAMLEKYKKEYTVGEGRNVTPRPYPSSLAL